MQPTPTPADEPVDAPQEVLTEEEEILKEEVRIGGTPRGIAANGVLLALSRAARSFLLYEPSNEAIRIFLENLRRAAERFLTEFGELELEVRPFELVHANEVVYLERDRERSLAFRLYRDGIRRLILRPGLTWHELLKLLEVVSIRYIGVRQTEDDLVVLLWKAGFQGISFDAVEGFVADADDAVEAAVATEGRAVSVVAPDDFDLPLPTRSQMVRVQWREVPAPALEELLEEDASQGVPELAVRLCEELLAALDDPAQILRFVDLQAQLAETRDFLFAEGLLAETVRLAYAAASVRAEDAESDRACSEFLQSFVSTTALSRFLHSLSRDATEAPPEMAALLASLPGDHMKALVEVLRTEHGEAGKRVTRKLLESYVPNRGAELADILVRSEATLACELLRVLRYTDISEAASVLARLLDRGELEVQLEVLHTVDVLPTDAETVRILLRLATTDNEEVRFRALGQIAARQALQAFPPLAQRLKREAALRMTAKEAIAIGKCMAACDPAQSLLMFREWCKPRGILGAVLPGTAMLQWGAVAGLAELPNDECDQLIKHVHERAGSELQAFCTQCMVARRRKQRGVRA